MALFFEGREEKMVDAIENGKIVRVPESYAKQEDLFILRKNKKEFNAHEIVQGVANKKKIEENMEFGIDAFRKPLRNKNQIVSELVDNFQWDIVAARKRKNMTRKQFAAAIGENENMIKMIENGIITSNDFILINKIQSFLGINIRKDGKNFTTSPRSLLNEKEIEKKKNEKDNIISNEIEIIEDSP